MKTPQPTMPEETYQEASRDLRNTLIYAGLLTLVLGIMIFASSPVVISLAIPPRETSLMALCSAIVAMMGLAALQLRWPVRTISQIVLIAYTAIITMTIHYTGGPVTPMPALYFLVVVVASFLLNRHGAMLIAILSIAGYALMLIIEYNGLVQQVPIWGMEIPLRNRGALLVINWLIVAIPVLFTAQLSGILAERLQETNAHLRESEQLQNSLTHMIIHDLRNPITAVMGGIELLLMTMADQIDETQKHLLENTRHSSQMLVELVNELLDINKIEAGKFELNLETVDMYDLLSRSMEEIEAAAELEKQKLEIAPPPERTTVIGDGHLLKRVIANLLSNALKYTPEGGTISGSLIDEGDFITVRIQDTGPGIPQKDQQRIFEKFTQVQEKHIQRHGTGLGLTFCQLAVNAHEGEIWVESETGEGSTFAFRLPVAGPHSAEVNLRSV